MSWNSWLVGTRPKKRGCLIWRKRVPQAQGAPAPVFFLPVSFLVLCHQPLTAALSSSFFASLLCHNQLCSVTTGHLLCQPHCHTRFLYRAAKKSAATSPSLFKPCLFLFQKSQLLGLSVTVMFVRFFERFFFSLIFSILFVHNHHYPPSPPLIPKPQSTSSSSRWTPSSWQGRAWGVSRRRLVMGAD